MIDQATFDKIRDTAQILDVVSEFVTLRRRGVNYIGLCPFHSDKTPSFYVSPTKNICKCFSCGEGGDPVHFLMKHETMSYTDAIRWLGKKYGIEIEERVMSREEKEAQTQREAMFMANDFAMKEWAKDLTKTQEGRSIGLTYFRERGFQDETIKRYGLGYALENKFDLAARAQKAGLSKESFIQTGLCYEDERRQKLICRFAGRVIFPYRSLSGKYVAFGGRILERVDHAFKKYVNSPESDIYHKGDLLYGIYEAKGEMAKLDKAYIVEGYFDVLSMAQAGIQNVIASSGTALTSGQIHMIQRFTKNVTLMFDGDGPGIKAALKSIDLLLLEGMKVKLLLLPDGDDPDSFSRKHTAAEIKEYFDSHETDFISFKGELLLREAGDDAIKRAAVMQNLVQSIALIQDPILSSIYTRNAAQMLNVSEPAVIDALRNQRNDNYVQELRRMETEQRRLIAQQQLKEKQEQEALFNSKNNPTSDTAKTEDASAERAMQDKSATEKPVSQQEESEEERLRREEREMAEAEFEARMGVSSNPPASIPAFPRPSTPSSPFAPGRLSDRFERNIIRNIVRSGGKFFTLTWRNPDGSEAAQEWRVIDFIGSELYADGIEFKHPLYKKMYQMAIDATEDPERPFESNRYFSSSPDEEVRKTSIDLMSDKYDSLGIVEHEENLAYLIPRCVLELKASIVQMELNTLKNQLRSPSCDVMAIMTRMKELDDVRKQLDKQLGERIVT